MKLKFVFIFGFIVLMCFAVVMHFSPCAISDEKLSQGLEKQQITNSDGIYTIHLKVFEENEISFVTFYVTNNEDVVVFESEEQWRIYDFQEIVFDKDDNIIVTTGDIGSEIYYRTSTGSWKKQKNDQGTVL